MYEGPKRPSYTSEQWHEHRMTKPYMEHNSRQGRERWHWITQVRAFYPTRGYLAVNLCTQGFYPRYARDAVELSTVPSWRPPLSGGKTWLNPLNIVTAIGVGYVISHTPLPLSYQVIVKNHHPNIPNGKGQSKLKKRGPENWHPSTPLARKNWENERLESLT